MSIVPFELPEELKSGVSAEEIVQAMLARIAGYDTTEGGFVWDMTMPTALEKAELLEFWLPLALQTMSHIWASGRWLDYHAADAGNMKRRGKTFAYGDVIVTTTQAVTFPQGFIFSVPSENSSPAIDFETVEAASIDTAGTLTIRVKAVEAGTGSNVAADTITIMKNPIKGVAAITNTALTGGTEAESDESLRQRIDDYYAGRGASFVGNRYDYERWSREVDGVGTAHCIPTFDGANSVKIVICDANGDPANQELCDAVYDYIFGKGATEQERHADLDRLAPIGSRGVLRAEVAPPTLIEIRISLKAKLADDITAEAVKESMVAAMKALFKRKASNDNVYGVLKYVDVSAAINTVVGLEDFRRLRLNGTLDNVVFAEDEMPAIDADKIELNDYD